jgi:O-antigen/teichoic acid export membrane protein
LKANLLSQSLSLRRNFYWTLVGTVFYSACQGGILIILARLGTPEMVGKFTFAFAVTAPLFMFMNLQLRAVQATDAQGQFKFNDYLGLRLASSCVAVISVIIITLILPYEPSTTLVVLIIGMAKAIESISDVCYGFMQQQERMDFISISLIGKGTLALLFLAICIKVSGSIILGALGLSVAWAIMLLAYDLRIINQLLKTFSGEEAKIQNLFPTWNFQIQRKLISLTLPLGFVMLLGSLNTNIPRYFIEHFRSQHELGIFAAIAYLTSIGSVIQGALAQAASPQLAKFYANGNRKALMRLLLKLIGLSSGVGLIAIILSAKVGKEILELIYKAEYAKYTDLLVLLMIAASLNYISSFLGTAITSVRYFRSQVPLTSTTLLIIGIGCFYLIPVWGLAGVPATMIIAEIVQISLFTGVLAYALRH